MAYTPLKYPTSLTKPYWDKKKGLLGKAAGETGVGEAAKKAEALFDKIDWKVFDMIARTPTQASAEALAAVTEFKKDMVAEHKKTVAPTIDAIKDLVKISAKAATELQKKKFSSSAEAAAALSKEADLYYASLQLNGVFFTKVFHEWDLSRSNIVGILGKRDDVMKQTAQFVALLVKGLAVIQKADAPDEALWNKHVKQAGRSVSNNLKGNPDLAKKYLKIWVTTFKGFDWGTLGFSKQKDAASLRKALNAFVADVAKEAKTLLAEIA